MSALSGEVVLVDVFPSKLMDQCTIVNLLLQYIDYTKQAHDMHMATRQAHDMHMAREWQTHGMHKLYARNWAYSLIQGGEKEARLLGLQRDESIGTYLYKQMHRQVAVEGILTLVNLECSSYRDSWAIVTKT